MSIFLNILFLVLGLGLLIKGADFFVMGASSVAKKLKVPSMVIGLTIVAIGTSMPELVVSISSAIKGSTDMSVGNVVGSNIFNMMICLGVVALFSPVKIKQSNKKIDFPFLIAVTGMLLIFGCDAILDGLGYNWLSRSESILLLVMLILYIYVLVSNARKDRKKFLSQTNDLNLPEGEPVVEEEEVKILKTWQTILCLIGGLGAVVFGGECVVSTAQFLAIKMGMSEALVGLTIVAMGTSLPELVTSIMASRRGENDLALGNVIGSNIMNIVLILGLVGTLAQVPISFEMLTDMLILFVFTLIFVFMCLTKKALNKKEGFILISMYVAYMAFAIVRNYCF